MEVSIGNARFDGARAFSGLMIWVCVALSATIGAAVIAFGALIVIFETRMSSPAQAAASTSP
jgi:hypothetical protein